jgi:hypothetical protein
MNFIPYHKINGVNHLSLNLIEQCKKIDSWCVCEKVHGSNFGFHWFQESNSIKYLKRSSFIENNDPFFNYKEMLPDTLPKIEMIIKIVNEKYSELNEIIIFGELFGGIYPNMKSKYKAIQKEVYYSPNLHFYAFDIYIKKNNEENGYFLDLYYCEKEVDSSWRLRSNKSLEDLKDNISEEEKNSVNNKVEKLREAYNNKNVDDVKIFMEEVNQEFQKISEKLYNNAQDTSQDEVTNVDFEEVK